jgi:hypothetical protein
VSNGPPSKDDDGEATGSSRLMNAARRGRMGSHLVRGMPWSPAIGTSSNPRCCCEGRRRGSQGEVDGHERIGAFGLRRARELRGAGLETILMHGGGDQRGMGGGRNREEATRTGRASASSTSQPEGPGRSTGSGSIGRPHESTRVGARLAGVSGGVALPEHRSPEHGIGGGTWPVPVDGPSEREASIPIDGLSAGCRQSAMLEEAEQRAIASSVRDAPAFAHVFILEWAGLITRLVREELSIEGPELSQGL